MTDKAAPMRQLAIAALSVVAMARPAESIAATAAGAPIHAQASEDATPAAAPPAGWNVEYGEKGLEIASPDRSWSFEPEFQVQLRFSDPFDDDPRTVADVDSPPGSDFEIRRARFKLDAQLGAEWLMLYSQTDLDGPVQLDLRVTIEPDEAFGVRLGQWKAEYNRERSDSSSSQQFVDRSIVNREFTIDRQQGAMLFGRLGRGSAADVSAWAGVFGGEGRGHFNDGGEPMYLARLQWNPNGRVLDFSQSDVGRRAEPASSIAVAAVRNRSRYTRFSSDGGGNLDSFVTGEIDQYEVKQWVVESALQWRGFSWQQEWHEKSVEDRVAGATTRLRGLYAQAGYFLHEAWSGWPEPLELALRYATVDPDVDHADDRRDELTFGANWYFNDHRHKLNADVSRLEVDDPDGAAHDWRVRLQWDVSF